MKKIVSWLLLISLMLSLTSIDIWAESSQTTDAEERSMQRLMALGVFSPTAPDKMELNRAMTREEMAAVMVRISGREDKVSLFKGTVLIPDVPATLWSNGYINTAVKLGLMNVLSDGRFHPSDKITFGQTAQIIGKLLKYEEFYLSGTFPENYMALLRHLNLLEGIQAEASQTVTRGHMALILDRVLETQVFGSNQKLLETLPTYQSFIVLENQSLNKKLEAQKVVTEKGIFTLAAGLAMPEAGKKYIARVKDGLVTHLALANMTFQKLSVKNLVSGNLMLNNGEKFSLPSNITYYYKGQPVSYSVVQASISTNSSLIMAADKNGLQYGVLFDPVHSEPRVVTADMAGRPMTVRYSGMLIDREGKYITPDQIEVNDVLYEITDIWNENGYVLIHARTVSGRITGILPHKVSPQTLEIDGVAYTLAEDFPIEKLNGAGSAQVGETCRLLLGQDGKAVDMILEGTADNADYVLVLNAYSLYSSKSEDFGTQYHYVHLLKSDGSKKVYRVSSSMNGYRGRLMKYKVTAPGKEYDTVELTALDYSSFGAMKVDRDNRLLGDYSVANGVVIFNIIDASNAGDVKASVLKWSDMPNGYLMDKKVKYLHTTGDFNDIDVMLVDDALEESIRYGLVIGKTTGLDYISKTVYDEITLLIDGKEYTYRGNDVGVYLNAPVRVKMSGDQVAAIEYTLSAKASGSVIDAVDASRIRIQGITYNYHKDITLYKMMDDNYWKKISTNELKKGDQYRQVTVYLDKPINYGGKVIMITLR
jgi:hypothetical protein